MKHANSPLAHSFENGRPTASAFAVSEALRQAHRPIRFAKVRYQGQHRCAAPLLPFNPAPVNQGSMSRIGKGIPVAVSQGESYRVRVPIKIRDEVTGLTKEVKMRMQMRRVSVLCYGMHFEFSCKAGSNTIKDGRDGQRKSLDFVKSELRRMLGIVKGDEQFAVLTAPVDAPVTQASRVKACPNGCDVSNRRFDFGTEHCGVCGEEVA